MRKVLALAAVSVLLAGCGSSGIFSDGDKPPLKGERISVLQLERDLVPDPALSSIPVTLPEAWVNKFWPQAGGYANHAMGHLTLAPPAALKKAWSQSIGAGGSRRTPLTAPPVVAEGMVFTLDTEGSVTAFDLKTGKEKWRQSTVPRGEEDSGSIGGGLAYASGKLYVTNGYKFVGALAPASGGLVWKAALPAPARSGPTVSEDRVYVLTLDNRLLALSALDGATLWSHTGVSEETNLLGSASVAADASIVVLPLSSGELLGLRPENGQVVWQDSLAAVRRTGSLAGIADIRGLPVIDQGAVFAASYSGRMAAIDQVSGRRLWQREIGSAETLWAAGEWIFAVTTEQQLAAFTRSGGQVRWNTQLPRYDDDDREKPIVWAGPVLAGGRLILASSGGQMAEADPATGKVLKTSKLAGDVSIPPVVADGTLLILTQDGTLAAYR